MTDGTTTSKIANTVRGIRLPRRRGSRVVLALVMILILGGGVASLGWWRAHALPGDAALRVGDQVETKEQFNQRVDTLKALYGVQPPVDPKMNDKFRRDSAKSIAVSLVLDHAAKQQGIVVADKSARDVLSRLIQSEVPGGGPEAHQKFIEALGNVGTSETAVVNEIKRQMAVSQLFNRVTANSSVTDREVQDAFNKRRNQLGKPEERMISNIVVPHREQADQVVGRLRQGQPFSEVAEQESMDGSTKNNGGNLGMVSAQQLDPGYAKSAFSSAANSLFGPVKTQFGWNVGMVDQVVPAAPAKFVDVQNQLRHQLESEKALSRWRSWLHDQISSADVTYAGDYQPSDPDSPPSLGGSANTPQTGKQGP